MSDNLRYTLNIARYVENDKQTLGSFILTDVNNPIFSGYSLELPWKNNSNNISCIPKGEYTAIKHVSPKFGECLWIQDVEGRSEVLIHKGNYYTSTRGCVLLGDSVKDINGDGILDITNSKNTIDKLLSLIEDNEIDIFIH